MHCGDQYPDKPPLIQFITEVNLPCVNPRNGTVSYFQYMAGSTRNFKFVCNMSVVRKADKKLG
jgi:ubiquitin-protein ligase